MKHFILLLSAVCCLGAGSSVRAQSFNNSYEYVGTNLTTTNNVLVASTGDVYFASFSTQSSVVTLYITRTDHLGNVSKVIQLEGFPANGKLVETNDLGVLFATYQNGGQELAIVKFDQDLNVQWSKYVPIGAAVLPTTNRIDIEKVLTNDGKERYLVLCASSTFYPQYVNSDAAFSLVYLEENGDLVWHRKYADLNRASAGFNTIRDIPSGLTSMKNEGGDIFFLVAGTRQEWTSIPQPYLFFQMVDEAGNIVSQYKRVQTVGNCYFADVVTGDNGEFVCVYTDGNTGFSGDPVNQSGVGLIPLIPFNLDPGFGRYYWQPQTIEHFGYAVTKTSDGDYMVACYAGWSNGNTIINPGLLKINHANLQPEFYKRYNIGKNAVSPGALQTDAEDYSYITGTVDPLPPGNVYPNTKVRLIKADPSGDACGAESYPVNFVDFGPVVQGFIYTDEQYADIFDQDIAVSNIDFGLDECNPNNNPELYRGTGLMEMPENIAISVVPTVIDQESQTVKCSFFTRDNAAVSIKVYNILGQLIHSQQENVTAGQAEINIQPQSWANGISIVQVYLNGKQQYTARIVKR